MTTRVSILGGIFLISSGLALAASAPVVDARASADATKAAATTTAQRDPRRPGAAKGPLPDPALLDGSTQQAEKKNEQGMLGEFELPGDDNAKSGKVGGQQSPGAKNEPQGPSISISLPGLPSAGGVPGGSGGGVSILNDPTKMGAPGASGGGISALNKGADSPPPAGAQGAGIAVGNDAGAGGIPVAELGTDESNGAQGPAGPGEKPKQVALGDSAMQIKSVSNAAGVVGAQPAGTTQQMEKAMGGGGKGSSGSNGNKGVEKGRAIPAGL